VKNEEGSIVYSILMADAVKMALIEAPTSILIAGVRHRAYPAVATIRQRFSHARKYNGTRVFMNLMWHSRLRVIYNATAWLLAKKVRFRGLPSATRAALRRRQVEIEYELNVSAVDLLAQLVDQ
jgi:hypothetical protein